ncbi:hypothetical protein ACM0P6_10735 [Komagataeibacter sucrofermentans]|uniref:Glycosyltransferase RgtA/B/C/D-like domain-containing protein n=1 Tax=Komagataeibacter sucrofermentans TaxID=1053551 RepID=A0A318QM02_9PROT|nr:hypothetical protein [Komagataeibacter sucrofermentans]PYD78498.1 hypothetical protein CFR77_10525 [Komagataeibacter sucrofermentans]
MKKILKANKILFFSFIVAAFSLVVFDLETIPFGGLTYSTCKWDCMWYRDIILHGYQPEVYLSLRHIGKAAWPFFPLFPGLAAGMKYLTGLTAEGSALLLNQTLFFFMVAFAALYYKKFVDAQKYILFIFLLCLSPFSLWCKVQYTECIYALITISIVYFAKEKKYIPLFLCAFLATLTRPTGIMLVGTCGAYLMIEALRARNLNDFLNGGFSIMAGSLGLSGYMLYLYHLSGDALAFSHLERSWGREFAFPGVWLLEAVRHGHRINGLISAFIDMFFLYYGFKKRMYLEASILTVTFLCAISSGLDSLHRYIMGNPLFVMIFTRLFDYKSKKFTDYAVMGVFVLNIIISAMWFNDSHYFY